MNNRINYFIKNTGIFLIGSFGSKFLSFFLMPMYTSILSTRQYGQADLVTTTQSLLLPIVTIGLSEAIFRFIMNVEIDNKKVLSNGYIFSFFTYIIGVLLCLVINCFIHWIYMPWMLIILAFTIFYDFVANYLKSSQKSKKYVVMGILLTFINLTLNIFFLIFLRMEVEGLLLANCISHIVPALIFFFGEKLYKQIRFKYIDRELAKRMIRYSFPLMFTSLSWWIVTSSDKYMIRFFLSDSEVGIYSIASKIPLLLQTLISILQTVWQISTNLMHDEEPQKLKENFIMFTRAFRQTGFISGSLLIVLTQPLMMILAKKDFYEGWRFAPFLILSIVFSFSTGMVATLYGAFEKNSGVLYSVLLGSIVNIILNALLIPFIGVLGATISTAISRLLIAVYRLKDTEKILQFDREYGVVAVNCIILAAQCSFLIFFNKWVYPIQLLFLVVICIINREIFTKGIQYFIGIMRRNKNNATS